MFIPTVIQIQNTRSLVKISAVLFLILSLYFLQSCQPKEAKAPLSSQQEEASKTETAFEKTVIQTEDTNQSLAESTENETIDSEKVIIHPQVTEALPVKNVPEVNINTNIETSRDNLSGDYIYLTSEGNFTSSDQPQTFAYHNKNTYQENSEIATPTLVENNQDTDSDTQSVIPVVQEKSTDIQNAEEQPSTGSEITFMSADSSQDTPDLSLETETQSHIVINDIPVNSEQKFKEIKISDVKSVQLVNQEVPEVNSSKSKVVNVTEKIYQSSSDIVRLYYPDHSTYVYDALLISKNSLGQARPLYVIDGTRIEQSDLYIAIVKRLNPDDIDSISFIKGNSATPLYGNKASEGALVINSKSGNLLQNIIRKSTGKSPKKSNKDNTKPKSPGNFVIRG